MFTRPVYLRFGLVILLLSLGGIWAADVSAQEILRVYGSEGPSPAINEAAVVFGGKHNVKIKVVSGPTSKWRDEAKANADVIFSSAEFMMSQLVRASELQIDDASITPLYMRPSAILVRPDNPKDIRDFPDLLRPGVRVMVVTGSGQTGLWEDMAGKQGDIRTIREFRKNIIFFAAHSTEAMKLWGEREDIDAWVTWNIWHMPLRDRAKLVSVSKNYRVHRQCSVALTKRGKEKTLAKTFIEFLTSPEGAGIFESWGWMVPPTDSSPITVKNEICAVARIKNDEWKDNVGLGLACLKALVEDYKSIGIPSSEVHVSAVFHGPAGYWLLNDQAYAAFLRKKITNPNKQIIHELSELGVSLELCAKTMKEHGWSEKDILPEVKIVPGAYQRIIDLELQGYAYIRF